MSRSVETRIADEYRHRAKALVASGRQPVCAVVIEYLAEGHPTVVLLGQTPDMTAREHTAVLIESMSVLAATAAGFHAAAGN